MLAIDAAAYRSPWRRRHPAAKAVLAGTLLLCALVLPPWPGAPITAAIALAVALGWARVPPRAFLRSARAPLAFVVTGSLTFLVSVDTSGLAWAPGGAARAGEVIGRCAAAVLSQLLFAMTTPLADVLPRLARRRGLAGLAEVAGLVYRMLSVVLETVDAVRRAQADRLGALSWRARWRSVTGLAAQVFVLSFERARRLEDGLRDRGYTGGLAVSVGTLPLRGRFLALAPLPGVAAAVLTVALSLVPGLR
ncbi:cobalt ECF transporter T component CbiQ [Microtetraspora malaysiensis]|uniref:cobalt ECF transporter T component CbiQ n=1 Tax=Microtetraspora malaysiensis TaxID=161358 RepID=UPI003D8AC222